MSLVTGVLLMLCLMGLSIFVQAFPYDPELYQQTEQEERAIERAIAELQAKENCEKLNISCE